MSLQAQPLSAPPETDLQADDAAAGGATHPPCTTPATHATHTDGGGNDKPQTKKDKFWNSWASEQLMQQGA